MALQLISYPFRVNPSGFVATNEEGADEQYEEELAQILLTRPGERPLVPSFGINDPTFGALDIVQVQTQLGLFGPPLKVTVVESRFTDSTHLRTTVQYEIEDVNPEGSIEQDQADIEGAI